MKHFVFLAFFTMLACAPSMFGQKWEVGGGVGASFYTSQDYKNALNAAKAGLSDGLVASFWLENNSSSLLGGELRYDYENTNLKLSSGSTNASFGADTHAIHYDFQLHFTPRGSHVRPFVAAGGGVKLYRGTGQEAAFQPLSNLALLTKANEITGLISVGAGIKLSLAHALQLRLEVHDFLTPFPKKVIAPAQGSKVNGWLQDFVALAGISFTF